MFKLTATELPRFVECNGYLHLEKVPAFNVDTTLRDEGDAAHWLAEQVFHDRFIAEELIDRKAFNGYIIDADMVEYTEPYIDAIKGRGEVESDTSYKGNSWQVSGRVDHIYADVELRTLFVDDFKYGWKIVEPDENWTLMSHAFGFLFKNAGIASSIDKVVIRIFQPRPYHPKGNIRDWEISVEDLWGVYWAKLAQMLDNPTDILNTNEKCYKCPSRSLCPAAQMSAMNAIEVSERAFNNELTPEQTSFMLDEMRRAEKVIKETLKAHEDAALHKAKMGTVFPNYTIQSDLSNEQWKDGVTVESMQLLTGKDLSKPALITPGQAKKKGINPKVLEPFYERKNKGAKLVPVSNSDRAKQLFGRKKSK